MCINVKEKEVGEEKKKCIILHSSVKQKKKERTIFFIRRKHASFPHMGLPFSSNYSYTLDLKKSYDIFFFRN